MQQHSMIPHEEDPFLCVRDGPLEQAKKVIMDMDIASNHYTLNQTVLFFACARKQPQEALSLARMCLSQGVNLQHDDCWSQTPLFYAAREGATALASLLACLGCSLNWRDNTMP